MGWRQSGVWGARDAGQRWAELGAKAQRGFALRGCWKCVLPTEFFSMVMKCIFFASCLRVLVLQPVNYFIKAHACA